MFKTYDLALFVALRGRFPHVGDPIPPWHFRGWLAAYVQALHAHPRCSFPDRWGYLQRVHYAWGPQSGEAALDPGPIPQVDFVRPDRKVLADLSKWTEIAGAGRGGWGWAGFRALIDFLSWGLATTHTQPELDDATCEKLYRTINLDGWLEHPNDYLATYVCEMRGNGWNPLAFYPTPHEMCELMIRLTMSSAGDNRRRAYYDPTCGTGRMLLHASNHSLRLYGQELDGLMVACAKINGALYAPWLVVGVPEIPDDTQLLPPPPTAPPERA